MIINYGGWQAELVRNESCGVVLPPDDPKRGAELLVGFLRDRDRVADSARNAKRVALTQFDRDGLSQKLLEILQEVAYERATK